MTTTLGRRDFLRMGGAALASTALPRIYPPEILPTLPSPAPLGRIATWWRQAVRVHPDPQAEIVTYKSRDDIIPIHAVVEGVPPWPSNAMWYQTAGGFIHSGYVQPVADSPSSEVITEVVDPGFWTEVCVPIAEARWRPNSPYVSYKLYHGTVYRVVAAMQDEEDRWWYQLKEGIAWSPGPYVLASSLRRIPPDALAPISPGLSEKWMQISIDDQTLVCFESDNAVFDTRISSGLPGTATPRGEHTVLFKRHTSRMIGGTGADRYDLPGVAFPVYFTWSGVAIHGTYWHNDYGRRHSHGCVNVTNDAARWICRWVDPVAPYSEWMVRADREGTVTRVVVI